MTAIELTLTLPDTLARKAQEAGLLNPAAMERLIAAELRRLQVADFFELAEALTALDVPVLTEGEIEAEVQATRLERATRRAARG